MSRKSLINTLENSIEPLTNQAMVLDMLGKEKKATVTLTSETTVNLDFSEFVFQEIVTGAQNITINAITTGMKDGEKVYLKVTQGAAARTITWGTGIKKGTLTVTASAAAVDLFEGIVIGGSVVLKAFLQNYS